MADIPHNGSYSDSLISFAVGCVSAIGHLLLRINWSQWAMETTLKVIEVGIVGLVGGAMGLIGKRLVEKYILKKQ